MPTDSIHLPRRVQQLLEDRQQHVIAIELLDATLHNIGVALGKPAVAMQAPAAAPAPRAAATKGVKVRRRRRGRFGMSADDVVLAFVKGKRNSTTQEINAHWKSQGRGGSADNTLSKLTKEKKLVRRPVEGGRGSRYTAA